MIIGQLERTEQVSHAAATEAERLMHGLTGKLVTGSTWAFAGKIASAFCGLAANAILARLLIPPTRRGLEAQRYLGEKLWW